MAKKFGPLIKKLQNAINSKYNAKITVNKQQYYVEESGKIAEVLYVKQATVGENGKTKYVELFSSGSDIAILLYLRDYWYGLNGWEIPTDNEYWEEQKRKYKVRQENREKKGLRTNG